MDTDKVMAPSQTPYFEYRKWFLPNPSSFELDSSLEIEEGEESVRVDSKVMSDVGLDHVIGQIGRYGADIKYLTRTFTNLPTDQRVVQNRLDFLEALYEDPDLYSAIREVSLNIGRYGHDNSSVEGGLATLRSIDLLAKSLNKLDRNHKSEEVRRLKALGESLENDGSFKMSQTIGNYLLDRDVMSTLGKSLGGIDNYISLRNEYGKDNGRVLRYIDNVDFRRGMTDTFKLLEEVITDLGDRGWIHFEAPKIASFHRKLEAMTKELEGLYPFDAQMSHREFISHNADRIKQFFSYSYSLISQMFTAKAPPVLNLGEAGSRLSTYLAMADFYKDVRSKGFDVSRPELLPAEERVLEMKGGVNPLLFATLKESDRYSIKPISFSFERDNPVVILTGPNNGGKTTLGRHLTLNQIMAQSGMLTLTESTRTSFVDGVYFTRSVGDNVKQSSGAYRAYLESCMGDALSRATPHSLVFLDELGTGTDTDEGVRVSEMVYGFLSENRIRTIHSTHLTELGRRALEGRYEGVTAWGISADQYGESLYEPKRNSVGVSNGLHISNSAGFNHDRFAQLTKGIKARFSGK